MGWEFAALWVDDPDRTWKWVWRRVANDSGAVLEESALHERLDDCVRDARSNGYDEDQCGPL